VQSWRKVGLSAPSRLYVGVDPLERTIGAEALMTSGVNTAEETLLTSLKLVHRSLW